MPTNASQADLCPMIEGKLTEAGRDPLHTQVVLCRVAQATYPSLQDETSIFSEVDPLELEDPPSTSPTPSETWNLMTRACANVERKSESTEDRVGSAEGQDEGYV